MKFYTPHAVIDDKLYRLQRVYLDEAGETWIFFEDADGRQETRLEKLADVELINELDAIAWASRKTFQELKAKILQENVQTRPLSSADFHVTLEPRQPWPNWLGEVRKYGPFWACWFKPGVERPENIADAIYILKRLNSKGSES